MKKALLTTVALAVVTSALAQGTVTFNNRVTGTLITQVFAPSPSEPMVQQVGNTAGNTPAGSTVFGGAALTGSGWTAQLFAINGSTIPAGPLTSYGVPVTDIFVGSTPVTTFRTGAAAGNVAATTATLGNVNPDAAAAVLQLRVFPSSFGNWAAAVAAFNSQSPLAIIGASPMFVVNAIGGAVNTPPNMVGLQSFSLVGGVVPEPSSFALAGMGLASLLIFRRRK